MGIRQCRARAPSMKSSPRSSGALASARRQGHRGHLPVDVVARAPLRLGGGPRPAGRQRPHAFADPHQALLAQGEPGGGEARPRDICVVADPLQHHLARVAGVDRAIHAQLQAGGGTDPDRVGAGSWLELGIRRPEARRDGGPLVERQLVDDGGGRERTPGDEDHHRRDRGPQHEPRPAERGTAQATARDAQAREQTRGDEGEEPGIRDLEGGQEGLRAPAGELGDEARERRDEQQDGGQGQPRDAGEGAVAARDGWPEDGGTRHQDRPDHGKPDQDVHGTARPVPQQHEDECRQPEDGDGDGQDPELDGSYPHGSESTHRAATGHPGPGTGAPTYSAGWDSRVIASRDHRAQALVTAPRCSAHNRTTSRRRRSSLLPSTPDTLRSDAVPPPGVASAVPGTRRTGVAPRVHFLRDT